MLLLLSKNVFNDTFKDFCQTNCLNIYQTNLYELRGGDRTVDWGRLFFCMSWRFMVCLPVCLSVGYDREFCQNG